MGSVPPRTNCSCDITPNELNHGATDQPAGRLVTFQEGEEEPKEAGKQFSLTSIRTWDTAARPRLGEDVASDPIQFVQAKLVLMFARRMPARCQTVVPFIMLGMSK